MGLGPKTGAPFPPKPKLTHTPIPAVGTGQNEHIQPLPKLIFLDIGVITVYCLIADELYPDFCQKYGNPRRAGFSPALTDPECLTLGIMGQFLGYPNQK